MRVAEKFVSIQGEGPYMGYRFSFIRLQGCNRQCDGCDTHYAQDREEQGTDEPVEPIVDWVMEQGIPRVVITGGEPMLQGGTLGALVAELIKKKVQLHLETNGDYIDESSKALYTIFDSIAVSLKSAVRPIGEAYMDAAVVERAISWATWGPNILGTWFLKFPIRVESLKHYAPQLREFLMKLTGVSVVLMPESDPSDDVATMAGDLKTLIEFTEQVPHVRVLPRLHRIVWGNKQGV